nr:phospholipase D Z-like [Tanacetum cinerariifolium]
MKQIFKIVILLISCNLFVSLEGVRLLKSDDDNECKAWLVQSIPTDMPQLPLVPGVLATADVLRWLAGNASHNLDIMAQYWQLVAHPDDPNSGDYGYSKEEMQSFGSNDGASVYKSIEEAADRNVNVRLLQHSGVYPDYTREPSDLASGRPNVKNVTLLISNWFESGVLHAKVWISDSRHVYIGSANNDWKSLTQVKEVGIYLADCPKIAKKVEVFYNNLWKLGFLNHSDFTRKIWDEQWQISRTVPCWSHFIPHKKRCKSPLPRYAPLSYLSFAPPELSFKKYQADEQAWVETIKSVTDGETVRISTMDWLGQSEYASQTVYWSSLSTAISEVIFSKHAKVKILVAYWAHFIDNTDVYLKSLLYSNDLCSSSPYNRCSGKIEIKYYMVPDFNSTGPAIINGTSTGNKYPGFTRVNHGKYAVSDKRAHIGTSNLMWDYFYATVGVSFGTYNPGIVAQLQQIFDADWNSPYAVPVEPLQDGHAYLS